MGDGTTIGAEPGGVAEHPIDYYPTTWFTVPSTDDQAKKFSAYMRSQLGKPYAYLDDGLIGLAALLGDKAPNWLADELSDDGQVECASLIDKGLLAVGIDLFTDGRVAGARYPGSYERYARTHGWVTVDHSNQAKDS